MYGPINQGGFNMIQIKDFFHALKLKWIQRYLSGIHDHWADIIDRSLALGPKNHHRLLEWGSNHPKINGIIKANLPSISYFSQSLSTYTTNSTLCLIEMIIGG